MKKPGKTGTAIGYLIDPHAKTITEVQLPMVEGNIPIADIRWHCGCSIMDVAYIPGIHSRKAGFDLWVDDEGLYRDDQAFFYITHEAGAAFGHRMFAGKCLVLGTDGHGNTVGTTTDMRSLARRIVWAHPEEGAKEAQHMLDSVSVTSYDSFDDLLAALHKGGAV